MTQLMIVGGFLGAGKTTLLLQAARDLSQQGYRVGLITNDQGEGLVDTAFATQQQLTVTEVAGGCFCCRFPDLLKAVQHLQEVVQPDIILAEPVGSCTDLVATVLRPLARYSPEIQLAPLTILFDPTRDMNDFNPHIHYLFEQQLAEAQIIVVNKADLLEAESLEQTITRLQQQYSRAKILSLSAHTGKGVDIWLNRVLGVVDPTAKTLDIDYERYTQAEAALGWLNAKGIIANDAPFSPRVWLENFFDVLGKSLEQAQAPIAHIKMQLNANECFYKASLTQLNSKLTWDSVPQDISTERLEFVLNARVNTSLQILEQSVLYALESAKPNAGARFYFTDFECFQPAPPKPTYRFKDSTTLESSTDRSNEQTTLLTSDY
jgi:Ni2+-binding GTPase involved in maturation of urease and hydrogenase